VLVCDPIHQDGISTLRKAGFQVEERTNLTPDQLEKAISDYDAVIVRGRTKLTSSVLRAGVKLKAVARSGVGLDNIDLNTAKERTINVISTPAAPTTSVAELAIGLVLAVLRSISFADGAMKNNRWPKSELMGTELKSKTVGVVGAAGRIGLEVARIALQGFGAKAQGYDIIDYKEKAKQIGLQVVDHLPDLLASSDVVTVHVPYLPSTHHLIDEKAIGSMKKGAILVNTSRGDLVDGQQLLAALKAGKISGAGLDVFHKEPPTDDWEKELVKLPNVVCTSHIGAQTVECQRLESTMVADQLIRVLKGR
jgi:D-3-phosphoglycerate dehydrogenase